MKYGEYKSMYQVARANGLPAKISREWFYENGGARTLWPHLLDEIERNRTVIEPALYEKRRSYYKAAGRRYRRGESAREPLNVQGSVKITIELVGEDDPKKHR